MPGEILWLFHYEDHLLPRGPLARLDWILNGLVSRLLYRGKFRGLRCECLLLSTSGKFAVEKALVLGLGKSCELSGEVLEEAFYAALAISTGLKTQKIALTLPDRDFEGLLFDPGRKVLEAGMRRALLARLPLGHLALAFYNKDGRRRDLPTAVLPDGILHPGEGPSGSPSSL